ncbi:helix-turn-helix transcriptional regulator [Shewanella sp. SW36]|uniref:helix-turn-helix transcriptional regulator n=1 Tax=unclassified Shewanella TaxID=196818 RepID=UPI0021D9F5F3|nr:MULTISPECIES: helix-turn-helix transcriptional regulator [unclassified Shewanella]MCU7976437.1 helix-turn-helix transcriptional regulator [Shewanella sp. SW36]MCU7991677.1 helix-turn-helix transcriptional regulator [Shewanella sp. SW1]MCU8053057.1 helix-turn-helix transcriptional regulator [Shewanella sp. SM43]
MSTKDKITYMKTLGQRIREKRKELGITQKALGALVGVSAVAVTQWEKDETAPKGANLFALAKSLKCDLSWLLNGQVASKPESNAEWAGGFDLWDNDSPLGDDEVEIPFYVDIELSAGEGIAEGVEYKGPKLRFAKSSLKRQGVNTDHAACVKVNGNSMEPVLPHGSTVGVDTSATEIVDGKMYAINHDGMMRVKMLYKLPGGGLRLRSYNLDEYPDERLDADQLKQVKVIGKVFWYSVLI